MAESNRLAGMLGPIRFPKLNIRHDDVSGSWLEFFSEFQLAVKIAENEGGDEVVGTTRTKRFNDKRKLFALLRHIGVVGIQTIEAAGYPADSDTLTYDTAVTVLKTQFESSESRYLKMQRFVNVSQGAGETYSSYMQRVEGLSRGLQIFRSSIAAETQVLDRARADMALVLAVNGLRDKVLCRDLIADDTLTWDTLRAKLGARANAEDSVASLSSRMTGILKIRSENTEAFSICSSDRSRRYVDASHGRSGDEYNRGEHYTDHCDSYQYRDTGRKHCGLPDQEY